MSEPTQSSESLARECEIAAEYLQGRVADAHDDSGDFTYTDEDLELDGKHSQLLTRAAAMARNWQDWLSLQSGDVQAMVKDAQRYRWLREHSCRTDSGGNNAESWSSHADPDSLDAAIDAAIAAQDIPDAKGEGMSQERYERFAKQAADQEAEYRTRLNERAATHRALGFICGYCAGEIGLLVLRMFYQAMRAPDAKKEG